MDKNASPKSIFFAQITTCTLLATSYKHLDTLYVVRCVTKHHTVKRMVCKMVSNVTALAQWLLFALNAVSKHRFLEALQKLICTGDQALRELPSPGKSGSVFFLSHDDRFIIKTMRKVCSSNQCFIHSSGLSASQLCSQAARQQSMRAMWMSLRGCSALPAILTGHKTMNPGAVTHGLADKADSLNSHPDVMLATLRFS